MTETVLIVETDWMIEAFFDPLHFLILTFYTFPQTFRIQPFRLTLILILPGDEVGWSKLYFFQKQDLIVMFLMETKSFLKFVESIELARPTKPSKL